MSIIPLHITSIRAVLVGLLLLLSASGLHGQESGRPAADELTLTPDTLDFGGVCVGTCAVDTIVIRNNSSFGIAIDSVLSYHDSSGIRVVSRIDDRIMAAGDTVHLILRFCPSDSGFDISYHNVVPKQGGSILQWVMFRVMGRGVRSNLRTPDSVRFIATRLDSCRDTTIYIRNPRVANIDSAKICSIILMNGTNGFALTGYMADTLIGGGDSTPVTLRFCPRGLDEVADTLVINQTHFIALHGSGTPRPPIVKPHRLLLDTASAAVGDPVRLRMRLDPPLDTDEKLTEYRIELSVDPAALYAQSITGSSGGTSLTRGPNGSLVVERPPNLVSLNGDLLFELNLIGLSTGHASNPVVIGPATLPGISISGKENGLVELTGCDLERDFTLLRRSAFRSVTYDPVSANVSIRCALTPGLTATLSMYDMNGAKAGGVEISPATQREQTVTIPCGLLPKGIYVLRLNDGVEMATVPVFITR